MKKFKFSPLPVIFLTVFVDLIGFGLLIPVIPLLLANPRSEYFLLPPDFTVQQGYILLGFLTAIYPLGQFFATPILGELSDKFGRKPVIVLSLIGTCISYLIFAFGVVTKNLPLLFLSRGFAGIFGGNISVNQAAIADFTPPKDRVKNFGLIGAAFGLGFILGPYIGGKLSDPSIYSGFSAVTPFLFAAALSFVNVLSVLLFFPETNVLKNLEKKINWGRSILNIVHAYGMRKLRPLFATNFFFQAGFTFFTTFFSVFLINKFNFTQGNIGDFFSYIGIWIALTQAILTRRLSKYFSESQIMSFTLFGTAIAVISFYLIESSWQIFVIAPFMAAFIGLTNANLSSLVSRSADPSQQGEILGINTSVMALAQAIPAMLSGFVAASLTPETPIIISSIILTLSGVLFLVFYRKPRLAAEASSPQSAINQEKINKEASEIEIFSAK